MTAIMTPGSRRGGSPRTAGRMALILGIVLLIGTPILPFLAGQAFIKHGRRHPGPEPVFARDVGSGPVHVPRPMKVLVEADTADRTTDVTHIQPDCTVTGPNGPVPYSANGDGLGSDTVGYFDSLGTFQADVEGDYRISCRTYDKVYLSDDALAHRVGIGFVGVLLPFALTPVMGILGLVLTITGARRLSATRPAV